MNRRPIVAVRRRCVDVSTNPAIFNPALNRSIPLSLTLVWTDPAGFPGAAYALVNDLDLEVRAREWGGGNSRAENLLVGTLVRVHCVQSGRQSVLTHRRVTAGVA